MAKGETIKGKGWIAYQRSGGQWVMKYRRRASDWRIHRVPRKFQDKGDVRRYCVAWLDERERLVNDGLLRRPVIERNGKISTDITFQEFAILWTSGELSKLYPRYVKVKKSATDDAARLRIHVYDIIGDVPIQEFEPPAGLEFAERVMAALPPPSKLSDASARQVAQVIHRTLQLAVFPAKLLSVQPLPKGFVPPNPPEKAKTYLYPDEEAKLMECAGVPLVERLFYGCLAREGARIGELLNLQLYELDLEHGSAHLDETKNDRAKDWALHPGTTRALIRWRDRFMRKRSPKAFVFRGEDGQVLDRYDLAENLRDHVQKAGVQRPQLFAMDGKRIWLRAHDLRASFVTVSLANGKTESWVADRTGHLSSTMINRYKRWARGHRELNLGDFVPLDEAIPELRAAPAEGDEKAAE